MNYENIEIIIRQNHPRIWQDLLSLHPTYKNQITRKIAENCGVFDCHELAEQVVRWVESCSEDVRNDFKLMSLSYEEIRERQRITGQRLTRKSNILRRNLRRILDIQPDADEFQSQFDADKLESEKTYVIFQDSRNEQNQWTAFDAKQKELRKRYAVNHAIAEHLDDFATNFLNYQGLFLSLTLPPEFHNCSYEEAKSEKSRRWTNIRRKLKYRNILHLGMSVLELQKDETPHDHIQLYVSPEHREEVESIILEEFPNENDRKSDAIQSIWDAIGCIGYCLKDSGKTDTYVNFIGLTKDIKTRYDNVYHNRKHKDLSDWRLTKSRKMMQENRPDGRILLMLRGFADVRLNSLSARHPDFYYVTHDIQRLQVSYVHCIHFGVFNDFNNNSKEETGGRCHVFKKTADVSHFYTFVASQVYNNQECIWDDFFYWECIKSRGQPPPVRERKKLNQTEQHKTYQQFRQIGTKNMETDQQVRNLTNS
ncbi:replication endonuclease [Acetobacter estunensis]|uniref:replication endonuclease n=1 Tax=Acetobacter estunensis TaxID=104097 RepID=UPI001C2D8438|nr:replication endonuclease [Acetobacter estunensis]MBV1838465.1 replication endonuclease [Acetobacter estunensis]